jgi:hypothetical protein
MKCTGWGCSSVVEHWHSMQGHSTWSPVLPTTNKNQKTGRERQHGWASCGLTATWIRYILCQLCFAFSILCNCAFICICIRIFWGICVYTSLRMRPVEILSWEIQWLQVPWGFYFLPFSLLCILPIFYTGQETECRVLYMLSTLSIIELYLISIYL